MARVLPENKKRSAYRKACPRHVVEFELAATEDQSADFFGSMSVCAEAAMTP